MTISTTAGGSLTDTLVLESGNTTVSGTLASTGVLTANAGVVVDNITIDGTEIDLSSGDLTLDAAGDIVLDADGGNVTFKDGGTAIGDLVNSSSDFVIESKVQDKDIIFKGDDGGSGITALTLDMSDAGKALFNKGGTFNELVTIDGGSTANTVLALDSSTANTFLKITDSNTNEGNFIGCTTDDLTFFTRNSEEMRIDSSGNVLIGATSTNTGGFGSVSPQLLVAGTMPQVALHETDNDKDGYIGIQGSVMFIQTADAIPMRFGTNDTERMRITSAGKVGVGSSDPQTKFVVAHTDGGIGIEFSMGDPVSFIQCYNRTSNDYASLSIDAEDIRFRTNDGSERMRITSAGDVGIGTTSPQSALHIAEGGSGSDGGSVITLSQTGFGSIVNNDDLGSVHFGGVTSGGVGSHACAKIMVEGDGTFGTNDFPTRMGFFTTADGGNTLSENMRLTNAGLLQLGTSIGNSTYAGLFNGVSNVGTGAIIQTRNGDGKKHFMLRGDNNVEYGSIGLSSATGSGALQLQGEDTIVFNTNTDTERMRISATGKILIGTTSGVRGAEDLSIQAASDAIAVRTAGAGLIVRKSSFGNGFLCLFENDSATQVGAITSGGSSTVFNTSSDYRLKEKIEPMQNGLERLNQLNPVKFTWKETGEESEGFIAHEVDEVFSDCIHGEKDGENMQGMDYGRITPLLVKAIQELHEQVDALQSEIKTLKGE